MYVVTHLSGYIFDDARENRVCQDFSEHTENALLNVWGKRLRVASWRGAGWQPREDQLTKDAPYGRKERAKEILDIRRGLRVYPKHDIAQSHRLHPLSLPRWGLDEILDPRCVIIILTDNVGEGLRELGVQYSSSNGIIKIVFAIVVYQGSDSCHLAFQGLGFKSQRIHVQRLQGCLGIRDSFPT